MSRSQSDEARRGLFTRASGRLGRAWRRFHFERIRPELAAGDITSRLLPPHRVDTRGAGGFGALLRGHLLATPTRLWEHVPPPAPDRVERARRGESELLGRSVVIDVNTDWHADPCSGVVWPRRHVDSMPYRRPGSDLVQLWHLNKTFHLLELVAAYRATGDADLAARAYAIMDSWCEANPFMVGANWLSPMEAGTRLVVWSQVLAGLHSADTPEDARCARIIRSLLRQSDFLAGHFSEWAIPNNHLIGEAATLFAFCAYWGELADSKPRMQRAEETIVYEVERQVLKDGFGFECSVNYHLYVLDWLLLYLHAKALLEETPPASVLQTATRMAQVAVALVSPSGRWPAIGDDSIDEFFALESPGDARARTGAVALVEIMKPAYAGLLASEEWAGGLLAVREPLTHATHLREAGLTVARDLGAHLVFVHGPQHRRLFADGHMHADAASFELEQDGVPVIIDAGTYLYTADAATRSLFRGARAHNAPIVDGTEPMVGEEAFKWVSVAVGEYLGSATVNDMTGIACRRRLTAAGDVPLEHTRVLVRAGDVVIVADMIHPRPGTPAFGVTHAAVIDFRTPTHRGSAAVDGTRVRLTDAARFVRVMESFCDHPVRVAIVDQPTDPASWYSPHYGELRTGVTVRVTAEFETSVVIVTAIRPPDVAVVPVEMKPGSAVFAIETAHRRRIARIHADPPTVAIGGYTLVGKAGDGPIPPPVAPRRVGDLTWLDELL